MTNTGITTVELSGGPADGEVYDWPADCFYMRVVSWRGLNPAAKPTDPLPATREYEYRDTLRLNAAGRRVFAPRLL